MLDAAKRRRWREGPLTEINNSEELEAWLRKQRREVSVAFAARAALRALPILPHAVYLRFERDFSRNIVLPVFRSTSGAWAVAKYKPPGQATRLAAAAAADTAAAAAADFADEGGGGGAVSATKAAAYAARAAAAAIAAAAAAAAAAADRAATAVEAG